MLIKHKTGQVKLGRTEADYVSYGKGKKKLVIIPGLGDGLKTVRGMGMILAFLYRKFGSDFQVYVVSRKNVLPDSYSTRDMAAELNQVMALLDIEKAHILGISQGGMIAQHLAVDYPQSIDRLVLAVTVSRTNATLRETIGEWMILAEENRYPELLRRTLEKTYTEPAMKRYRPVIPLLARFGKPQSFDRFLVMAQACLDHDAYESLQHILSPTLVIGGDADRVVGEGTSQELAEQIPTSRLILYPGVGHGVFDEAKDFYLQIQRFLTEEKDE